MLLSGFFFAMRIGGASNDRTNGNRVLESDRDYYSGVSAWA